MKRGSDEWLQFQIEEDAAMQQLLEMRRVGALAEASRMDREIERMRSSDPTQPELQLEYQD